MPKSKYIVQPQRSNGTAYVPVDITRATSFAVMKETWIKAGETRYKTLKFVSRHSTRTHADSELTFLTRRDKGSIFDYVLGRRMLKKALRRG